jgi:pilus assembly protein CpaE
MSLIKALGLSSSNDTVRNADFVAFVSDDANTEVMRNYVALRTLPHALVERGSIAQAISVLSKMERPPARLVVDVSKCDTPLSELTHLAEVCDPSVEVYVLGSENDVGLYRNLLQLGVRDYLVKPLTVDLLTRTLGDGQQSSVGHVQRSRTGKVLTLLGTRGGVGVSTVGLHLAQHLAEDKMRRVALVDLNIYGGAVNVMIGQQTNQGLTDVLQNVHRLDTQYMDRTMIKNGSRLFLLTCELDYADRFNPEPGALGALIDVLKHYFHYVIIDAPPPGIGTGVLTEEALNQSKVVYILADKTVHSARSVTRLARHVVARSNEPAVSVLLNHTTPPATGHVNKDDFARATQREILLELPYDASGLTMAQNLGERINPRSGFAKAIAHIANDLSGTQQKTERTALWGGGTRVRHTVR